MTALPGPKQTVEGEQCPTSPGDLKLETSDGSATEVALLAHLQINQVQNKSRVPGPLFLGGSQMCAKLR